MKHEPTFTNWRKLLTFLIEAGFVFRTHDDFIENGPIEGKNSLLLRHDVDYDKEMRKTQRLIEIENELGVASTVFVRLHDPQYNTLAFREMYTIQKLLEYGCELGLHCETADIKSAFGEDCDEVKLLKRDIKILETAFDVKITGVAPHGDLTSVNNQDILDSIDLSTIGIKYHAYQQSNDIFNGWYISNYAGNDWKRYVDGKVKESGKYDFMDYAQMAVDENVNKITFLVHPARWYDIHYMIK